MGADSVVERYGHGKKDEEFIPQLDSQHDVFVTYDRHIQTRPAEARALQAADVRSLFFGPWWKGKRRWEQAEWLITMWRKVDAQVRQLAPGAWVWVRSNGDFAAETEYPQRAKPRRRGGESRGLQL